MYRLSLEEQKNGQWYVLVWTQNSVKTIKYSNLELAIKELKRAVEIRQNSKKIAKKLMRKK
jgi:hypothetical protein